MTRNLPYKNREQVKSLRNVERPVRRYGDHSKGFKPKSLNQPVAATR